MESVYGQTVLSVGSWYTFKGEVTPEKIALSVYERGGKTPLETLTIGQDSSVYAKLFEPYNIWFDMWGSPDLADTQPVRMDLDNLMISSGIYEGLEQPPESAVIQTRPFDTVTVRADGGEVKVDNVSLQNMDGSYTLHRESFDELTQSALPDLWKAEGDTVAIKADNGGQATGRSVFAGKKVSILGDSISTYAGVSDNTAYNQTLSGNKTYYPSQRSDFEVDGTWWMQAIRAYDMELLVNNAYSGDKLNPDKSGKGLTRCRQLHGRNGQQPDVIFIYFGTNDAGGHKVVENNLEVFRGNYPKLMDSLAADYPQAQVYFFTLLPRTEFDNTPYSDVIRQLVTQSANPNFHLVDIQKESGITLANLANYTVDGNLHPNKVGMTKLADTLVTAMEQSLQGMETTNGSNLVLSGSGQASLALDTPVSGVRASMSVCFERFGGGVGLYWDNRCVISLRTGKDGRMEYFADGVWTAVKGQKLETGRRYELSLESAANSTRTVISLDGKAIVDVKLGLGEDTHTCPGGMMQDVTDDVWYHEAVDYALANSLMSGYSAAAFGPNDTLNRAMVVQVLYNKEDKPARAADHTFPDVKAGDWYNNAVAWAAERKVVSGYGDGRFGPNDAVTLEQVLVILWNYSGNPALTGDADAVGPHSDWAGNAIGWAQAAGVLENVPFDTVTAPATRAQTAQMLMNLLEM